jgi:formylmethanofuran dehydrogenase subunit C
MRPRPTLPEPPGPVYHVSGGEHRLPSFPGDAEHAAIGVKRYCGVRGAGAGRTVIAGNVIIRGNSAVFTALTIEGNVTISGNNANLQGANIRGRVINEGNANSW